MSDHIVGMMFNRNEGDILEEVIKNFLPHVDSLFIADDNSTDNSREIINEFRSKIEYYTDKRDDPKDVGQRQKMLNEIRRRHKPEETWVQILDSDMMILDTDIKKAISKYSAAGLSITWTLLNGCRIDWSGMDTYPIWNRSIKEIMPWGHVLEDVTYTFRPLPKLYYNLDKWRPWPQGFSYYTYKNMQARMRRDDSPIIAHYGYRGPTHFYLKNKGKKFAKYPSWDISSVEAVRKTVYYFNGYWNTDLLDMSRKGWVEYRLRKSIEELQQAVETVI